MKIAYAGSPQYAVAPLAALIENGAEIVAVITQPDRPFGRKMVITPTPVKAFAQERGLKLYDFPRLKDHAEELKETGADLLITCAYGQLLTQEILDIFPMGVFNLHASLLPKYRGASPIQAAILDGCEYTGVTVMKTELALDSGAILLVKRCHARNLTCGELSERLSALSAEAAVEAVKLLERGECNLLLQDEGEATYCKKITKAYARVDFSLTAQKTADIINAMSPSPAAFCYFNGHPLNLLKAEAHSMCGSVGEVLSADRNGIVVGCGEGSVKVTALQFAGGKVISAADAVCGRKIKAGDRLD